MSQLIVQKYGGTSVGSLARIQNIANHIYHTLEKDQVQILVVVSAMGAHTDELYEMAHTLHPHPPKRELDMLVTSGERISAALLSIALARLGLASISLTGSQSGILTDDTHGNARISKILGQRIREGLQANKVVIVAGFQGMNLETKDVTTLGRGGSDLTAVALASHFKAALCQIYTDVLGVMTADPRTVPSAQLLTHISWESMSCLAWAGAGILHHRAAFVASKDQVPLEIRSSLQFDHRGTLIHGPLRESVTPSPSTSLRTGSVEGSQVKPQQISIKGNQDMESPIVYALAHKTKQIFIRIHFEMVHPRQEFSVAQVLRWLWKNEESPPLFRQFKSLQAKNELICELVCSERVLSLLSAELPSLGAETFSIEILGRDLALLSLVGAGFRQSPEIIEKILGLLPEISVLDLDDNTICIAVPMSRMEADIQTLHQNMISNP
ncbi:MAG: aspartate kinase [Oligoflexales bacterium]|nr:aspartate kinase [Oligoflexales bacterium]